MKHILMSLIIGGTAGAGLKAEAVTTEAYLEFNAAYTESYFDHLQFKRASVIQAKELRAEILTLRDDLLKAQSSLGEVDLRLEGIIKELSALADSIGKNQSIIDQNTSTISSLKQGAVSKGYFTIDEDISSASIALKLEERAVVISSLTDQIQGLKGQIEAITETKEYNDIFSKFVETQKNLNFATATNTRLANLLKQLNSEQASVESRIDSLKISIPKMETREADLNKIYIPKKEDERSDAQSEVRDASDEEEGLRADRNRLDRQRLSLADQMQILQDDRTAVSEGLLDSQAELDDLDQSWADLPGLEDRLRRLRNRRIPEVRNELSLRENDLTNSRNRAQDLREKTDQQKDLNESLKVSLEEARGRRLQAKAEVEALEAQIIQARTDAAELPQLKDRRQDINRNLIPAADQAISQAETDAQNGSTNISAKQTEVEAARASLSSAQSRRTAAQQDLEAKRAEVKRLNKRVKSLEEQIDTEKLNRQISNTKDRIQTQETELATANQKFETFKARRITAREKINELKKTCTDPNDPCQKELERLEKRRKNLAAKTRTAKQEANAVEAKLAKSQERLAELEGQLADTQAVQQRIDTLVNVRIPEAISLRSNAKAAADAIQTEVDQANAQFRKAQGEMTTLQERQRALRTRLSSAKSQKTQLESELETLRDKISRANTAQERIASLTRELRRETRELETARTQAENLRTEVENSRVQLEDLRRLLESERLVTEQARIDRDEAQSRFNEALNNLKLIESAVDRIEDTADRRSDLRNSIIPSQESRLKNIGADISSVAERIERVNSAYNRTSDDLAVAQSRLENAETALSKASSDLADLESERKDLISKISEDSKDLSVKQARLETLIGLIVSTKTDLLVSEGKLSAATQAFETAKGVYNKYYATNISPLDGEIESHQSSIATQRSEVSELENLDAETTLLSAQIEKLTANNQELSAQQADLLTQKSETEPVREQMATLVNGLQSSLKASETSLVSLKAEWDNRADAIVEKEQENDELRDSINDDVAAKNQGE